MIRLMSHDMFKDFLCSLRDASLPDSKDDKQLPHVTDSNIIAINFDKATAEYSAKFKLKSNEHNPKSSDSVYQHSDGDIYLVEFKSSKPSGSKKDGVKLKPLESLLTFMDIFREVDRDYARLHITFVLVFSEKLSVRERGRSDKLSNTNQPEIIYCGLERLKGVYFKNVITKSASDFAIYITEQGWTSMV